jgi:hypothetical protein
LKKIVEGWQGSSPVTEPMVDALLKLVNYLKNEYGIDYSGGHNEFHSVLNSGKKASGDRYCPGDAGSVIVNYIRIKAGLKSPILMTSKEKEKAGNY